MGQSIMIVVNAPRLKIPYASTMWLCIMGSVMGSVMGTEFRDLPIYPYVVIGMTPTD
jgi:hypothetical protein